MKNILVSGVSRGLGFEIAQQLLEQQCQVYGFSRKNSNGVEKLTEKYPDHFHWYAIDLNDLDHLKNQLFQNLLPPQLPLHGLVNNAAIAYDDLVSNINLAKLQSLFNINTLAPILISKWVLRNMLLYRTSGSLVHISSISTQTGYKGLSMYAASKGALEAFSKNVAREWGPKGIRSNCVVPGFMETAMSASLDEQQRQKIYHRNALRTATSLQSVAATVCFLISNNASSITGQEIVVDAGS